MVRIPAKFRPFVIAGILFVLGISLPISNLFIHRSQLAKDQPAEFQKVSDILVAKCADCHTKDLAQYPLYYDFPIANSIAHANVKSAQSSFLISKDKLSGRVPFSEGDVERLSRAMAKGDMPPIQYIALHWDSALNEKEQRILSKWIEKRLKEFDLRPIPKENFFRPDPARVALGKKLFHDKRLSENQTQSCASCHSLQRGGADQLQFSSSAGGKKASVNTPTVLNAAYNIAQYWNGRAENLKAQALEAISNPAEMNSDWNEVCSRLRNDKDYDELFRASYPNGGITASNVSDAIAEYEHTLLTPESRYDRFLSGDQAALTTEEREGFELFKKHECFVCHTGPSLGGLSFEKLGKYKDFYDDKAQTNLGRFELTHRKEDLHVFKVPSLRNVELTYPYMHDGSAKTLEEAVRIMSQYQTEKPMTADEERKVVAFLRTLTSTTFSTEAKH
jgi:cytochrome c peroxidase